MIARVSRTGSGVSQPAAVARQISRLVSLADEQAARLRAELQAHESETLELDSRLDAGNGDVQVWLMSLNESTFYQSMSVTIPIHQQLQAVVHYACSSCGFS